MGLIDKLKGIFEEKKPEGPKEILLSKIFSNGYYRISTPEKAERNINFSNPQLDKVARKAAVDYPQGVLVIDVGSAAARISLNDYQTFVQLYQRYLPGKKARITQGAWIALNRKEKSVVDRIDD
jgi:hypothetical protein